MSDRRGVRDKDFEVQGRENQTRGTSACSSLNRCEPSLPNSIPARGVIEGHTQRPDTRPIEDPAENKDNACQTGGIGKWLTYYNSRRQMVEILRPPLPLSCEIRPAVSVPKLISFVAVSAIKGPASNRDRSNLRYGSAAVCGRRKRESLKCRFA